MAIRSLGMIKRLSEILKKRFNLAPAPARQYRVVDSFDFGPICQFSTISVGSPMRNITVFVFMN